VPVLIGSQSFEYGRNFYFAQADALEAEPKRYPDGSVEYTFVVDAETGEFIRSGELEVD
jgi:hypothetical protein